MSTTTATTGPPQTTEVGEPVVRQRASTSSVADAVQQRVRELHSQGVRIFTPAHFQDLAATLRRPASWITDHLLVLEGIGILRPSGRSGERAWTVSSASEYLR